MATFPDWQRHIVKQKRPATGCIPTGYEMLIRAAGISGVNFETFQDEFDLDKDWRPGVQARNNFDSVAKAIQAKYPAIRFRHVGFPKEEGTRKVDYVEAMVRQGHFVLVSLARERLPGKLAANGWHITPVVAVSADTLTLLWGVDPENRPVELVLPKTVFATIHEVCKGGDDIAFLDVAQPSPAA